MFATLLIPTQDLRFMKLVTTLTTAMKNVGVLPCLHPRDENYKSFLYW